MSWFKNKANIPSDVCCFTHILNYSGILVKISAASAHCLGLGLSQLDPVQRPRFELGGTKLTTGSKFSLSVFFLSFALTSLVGIPLYYSLYLPTSIDSTSTFIQRDSTSR